MGNYFYLKVKLEDPKYCIGCPKLDQGHSYGQWICTETCLVIPKGDRPNWCPLKEIKDGV
jgi:hypothetical protein